MPAYIGLRAAQMRSNPRLRLGIASNRNKTAVLAYAGLNHSTRVVKVTGIAPVANPVLRCPWWYVSNVSAETAIGNGATIYASIEYPVASGAFYQATSGGAAALVVPDQSNLGFDPIMGLTIPANTAFAVHTLVVNSVSTNKWPVNCYLASRLGDGYEFNNSALTNKTMTGGEAAAAASAPSTGYSPIVLGSVNAATARDAIVIGDSIGNGDQEDSNLATGGDGVGNLGAFERLLGAAGFAYLNMARAGTKTSQWQAAGSTPLRQDLIRDLVTKIGVNQLGANDSTATVSVWSGYMATVNNRFLPYVGKMLGTTKSPYTTSTDAWATPGNQTPTTAAFPANFNTAVRAGTISGQTGYLEYNYALSEYAGSGGEGIWRSAGSTTNSSAGALTPDGLHTVLLGAAAGAGMSAAPLL